MYDVQPITTHTHTHPSRIDICGQLLYILFDYLTGAIIMPANGPCIVFFLA